MTGYVRTDTTNNIADGNIINATDLDNEFDGVQAAFNSSTGHNHDGTTGEGAPILVLGPTQDVVVGAAAVTPKTTNTVDIGSGSLKFKDLFLAGNASIGGTLAVTGVATLTAQPVLSSLTASSAVATDASKGLVSVTNTGTGNNVLATSPTLVTPILGTPTSATLTNATGLPVATGISGLGTGVATALAVNVGTAGAPVINGGVLGTPSSGTVTNLTGTASININGTVGATTASTGAFTTLTTSSTVTLNGGTANGVAFLDASKVLTTGSALTFDGTNLGVGATSANGRVTVKNSVSGELNLLASQFSGSTDAASKLSYNQDDDTLRLFNLSNFTSSALIFGTNSVERYRLAVDGTSIWSVSGSEQMRLTSTGLGIGTSSPVSKLNVVGTTGITWASAGASSGLVTIGTQGTGGSLFVQTPSVNDVFASGFGVDGTYDGGKSVINLKAFGTASGGSYSADMAFFTTTNTTLSEKMRLDSSGNLGLGVTPSAWASTHKALQMNWSAFSTDAGNGETSVSTNAFASAATTWNYRSTAPASRYTQDYFGKHIWYTAPSGTAGDAISFTQAMTLDASGNLAVAATAPVYSAANRGNITVGGSNSSMLFLGTGGTSGTYLYHDQPTANAELWNGANGYIRFGTNDTERARITSGGELLVGLTSATGVALLQVSGPIRTTGYTVATLPAGTVGMRTYVTDALAPSFGVAVAGSGAVTIPVFYDGANWIVA